ncbi:hypothetical protein CJP74_01380 [Psittacicella melopsittaci]|uniref:Uncharacterized protein n=1 Tax=Psittacicella melopsittaci TaxID=2028576 RepID=A0A3A1YC34_9GAMM|nr:hypothetical protein [Psittacicella melopsittaci]RIY33667.1 hypothetical protein CJP74_01380 [Psittacicella melopsittaci]
MQSYNNFNDPSDLLEIYLTTEAGERFILRDLDACSQQLRKNPELQGLIFYSQPYVRLLSEPSLDAQAYLTLWKKTFTKVLALKLNFATQVTLVAQDLLALGDKATSHLSSVQEKISLKAVYYNLAQLLLNRDSQIQELYQALQMQVTYPNSSYEEVSLVTFRKFVTEKEPQLVEQGTAVRVAELDQLAQFEQAQAEQDQIDPTQEQLATTQAQLDQTQAQLATTQAQLDQAQSQLATTQAQLDQAQSQLATTQAQLDQAQAQLATTQAQLEQDQAQLAVLEEKYLQLQERFAAKIEGQFVPREQKPQAKQKVKLLYGAPDRVKNHLSYRLGTQIIKAGKSFPQMLLLPYNLAATYRSYRKYRKSIKGIVQPRLKDYQDYAQGEQVMENLSYRLGKVLIQDFRQPYKFRWLALPKHLRQQVLEFRQQKKD